MKWVALIGLFLNFIGTILVAVSFGKNLGGGYQNDARGRKVYLASFLYPSIFKSGLALLALGFVFQAVPEVEKLLMH